MSTGGDRNSAPRAVGIVGAGALGGRIADRLMRQSDCRLRICDTDTSVLARFEAAGLEVSSSASDCRGMDVVLVLVATEAEVVEIATGSGGLLDGVVGAPLVAIMSTISSEIARSIGKTLSKAGARTVDAPVSGGLISAERGELTVMIGGADRDVAEMFPILSKLAAQTYHCGGLGSGQAMKIVNNMIGLSNLFLAAEAYDLARVTGVDLTLVASVLENSTGRTFASKSIHETRGQYAAFAKDLPAFERLKRLVRKNLSLALQSAANAGVNLPVLAGVLNSLDTAPGADGFERWRLLAELNVTTGVGSKR